MIFGEENTFQNYNLLDINNIENDKFVKNNSINHFFGDEITYKFYDCQDRLSNASNINYESSSKIFGNDNDFFCYTSNENLNMNDNLINNLNSNYSIMSNKSQTDNNLTAQNLLNLYYINTENDIQSQDCSRIDIGNPYANYEIQRPCNKAPSLYSRSCPCYNDNKERHRCNNLPNCNRNCGCPSTNKKPNAEKLSRKIYQQLIFASSCVANLIAICPCNTISKQLVEVKQNLDTLGVSMFMVTKRISKCNPIFMNNSPNFENNCFNKQINEVIELLSQIIKNLVLLQKLPDSKCCINAILIITFGIIMQQNKLISINTRFC